MSDLPYSDPSNPALPSPLFSDITAVRGDHLRANNAAIFTDLNALNARNPELVALTSGSFKTAALANANTYNGRSLFTCTAAVTDTPSAVAWRIVGHWNPADSSGRFVAMADASLETWEINYSGAAWGTWTRLTDASGNLTRNLTGNVTGNVTGDVTGDVTGNADTASSMKETGSGAVTRWKIIPIGDWNMDSTESVNINHGLTLSKIRGVSVIINRDDGNYVYPLQYGGKWVSSEFNKGGDWVLTDTYITLVRSLQGFFDITDFNSTSFNRGFITIEYSD